MVVALALLCVFALVGCTNDEVASQPEPSDTAPTPAITIDPDFYTWQQAHTYTGTKKAIATTVWAANYYGRVVQQVGGGVSPELEQVTTDSYFGVLAAGGVLPYPRFRGPMRSRLLQISREGDHMVAVWCEDHSEREVLTGPTPYESWEPKRGSAKYHRKVIQSASSPTGWRVGKNVEVDLGTNRCEKAFQCKEPALTATGPPELHAAE